VCISGGIIQETVPASTDVGPIEVITAEGGTECHESILVDSGVELWAEEAVLEPNASIE
jgi:hypothetical protein